jgi:amino acid transporter
MGSEDSEPPAEESPTSGTNPSNSARSSPSSGPLPADAAASAQHAHAESQSPDEPHDEFVIEEGVPENEELLRERLKTLVIGKPLNLADKSIFHHVSLVAFLAWVGLGADGLSSSCYGPAEAFTHLIDKNGQTHLYLAVFLSLATIITIFVISACYSHIIEEFPTGGGGYLVSSKLLGPKVGVVSGCALLVDYVLTITVSIAAAGDALFGLFSRDIGPQYKLTAEYVAIAALIVLNLRGVRETVKTLLPVFLLFLVTHAILIGGAVILNAPHAVETATHVREGVQTGLESIGLWAMFGMLLRAYSLGAGTYTGIEAVSNSMPVMREPRVATAKRTMLYMAVSLAVTAGGLMVSYLLLDLRPPGHESLKTMNFLLTEQFLAAIPGGQSWLGSTFLWATILSEGALLWVAAQAGFIDGPRVMANLAQDSWAPHWFANLSERLATHNGILLMGGAALAALWFTGGKVSTLVIMYSINVFLTFSLSMIGMCRHWWQMRARGNPLWRRRLALFGMGAVFCVSILCVTIYEKFFEGGWRTLFVTGALVLLCFGTHRYYRGVVARLKHLNETLGSLVPPNRAPNSADPDRTQPTAAILVGGYGGLGVHTLLNAIRFSPGYFKNFVFLSVGVVDSGNFKGADAVDELREHTEEALTDYVMLARKLGMPAVSYLGIGTDAVDKLEEVCLAVKKDFPRTTFFAGQLVFRKDAWYQRLFHNQTAYALQRRLQWDGVPMVILPTRVREADTGADHGRAARFMALLKRAARRVMFWRTDDSNGS